MLYYINKCVSICVITSMYDYDLIHGKEEKERKKVILLRGEEVS